MSQESKVVDDKYLFAWQLVKDLAETEEPLVEGYETCIFCHSSHDHYSNCLWFRARALIKENEVPK